MKLAVMQPYFFPYTGYFSLISSADKFILLDTVQYIRHGWVNRNRILKPNGQDWQYISVPLKKHPRNALIQAIEAKEEDWKSKLLGQLHHYKKKATYFKEVLSFVEKSLEVDTLKLSEINTYLLKTTCDFIDIPFNYEVYSRMNLCHAPPNDSGEWALNISEALEASCYINLPGGRELFDENKFREKRIQLQFIEADLSNYRETSKESFLAGLSILDVLMYKGRKETKRIIENYKLTA